MLAVGAHLDLIIGLVDHPPLTPFPSCGRREVVIVLEPGHRLLEVSSSGLGVDDGGIQPLMPHQGRHCPQVHARVY